jgi:hypothetical protein
VNKSHEEGEVATPSESEPSSPLEEENESDPSNADSPLGANSSKRIRGPDEYLLKLQSHTSANVKVSDEYLELFKRNCTYAMKRSAMHGEESCGHILCEEQLARGLTRTTDESAETANPYRDSLSEQVFSILTECVRLARHREIEVNMQRLCHLGGENRILLPT